MKYLCVHLVAEHQFARYRGTIIPERYTRWGASSFDGMIAYESRMEEETLAILKLQGFQELIVLEDDGTSLWPPGQEIESTLKKN